MRKLATVHPASAQPVRWGRRQDRRSCYCVTLCNNSDPGKKLPTEDHGMQLDIACVRACVSAWVNRTFVACPQHRTISAALMPCTVSCTGIRPGARPATGDPAEAACPRVAHRARLLAANSHRHCRAAGPAAQRRAAAAARRRRSDGSRVHHGAACFKAARLRCLISIVLPLFSSLSAGNPRLPYSSTISHCRMQPPGCSFACAALCN